MEEKLLYKANVYLILVVLTWQVIFYRVSNGSILNSLIF